VSKREFPCALGTFSVKRERVYGCSGIIRTILGAKNGVFTNALSDELSWKHSGLKSGHTQGRACDGFSIIILLYGWFWLLLLEYTQGSSTCGWGKYVVGILPLLVTWFCHVTSGLPYSPQSAYITPLSFLVLRNQLTFTL
jgi:hypothetical protein